MKRIKIFSYKDLKGDILNTKWEESPVLKTMLVKETEDIWDTPLLIGEKFYSVRRSQGDNYAVEELEYFKHDEDVEFLKEFGENNIKCPVCGYKESDCHEYNDDEDGEHICQCCGSTLHWTREVSVTYTTKVEKINGFKEVN